MALKTVKAIINGVEHVLTYNGNSGKYEATVAAPGKSSYNQMGHYYDVTVQAMDDAGNISTANATTESLGESLRLVVKEKVAPIITITAPTASATITNNKPAVTWTVTDSDSGVNPDTIKLTIDTTVVTAASITKSAIANGYSCSYTPTAALGDGSHDIKADANDNDGNTATQKTSTFKIDTVPPTLSVTSPVDNLITNVVSQTVSGVTNDAISSPVSVAISLNGTDQGTIAVAGDGAFSKAITLKDGANTIVITATDGVGKVSTVTRVATLDVTPPTITAVTIAPNPVNAGATYVISVSVTD